MTESKRKTPTSRRAAMQERAVQHNNDASPPEPAATATADPHPRRPTTPATAVLTSHLLDPALLRYMHLFRDPTRCLLMAALIRDARSDNREGLRVSQLTAMAGVSQPSVSRNLFDLMHGGMVVRRTARKGKATYTVDAKVLRWLGREFVKFGERLDVKRREGSDTKIADEVQD